MGPQGPKGDTGPQGPKGDTGSDATVTAENIETALGYKPVREEDVNQLKEDLSDVNKIAEKAYIMTDARDNKKYGMEWGVNKDGYPTVTFQEVTE